MIEFDGMSRPEITKILSISTEKNINPNNDTRIYWAKEVTFDYSTTAAGRVDFMRFKPVNNSVSGIEKGDFYCFEVKSSVNDFHSKNGHNFLGDFNYYVMPENVFDIQLEELRLFNDLSYDLRFIDEKRYKLISEKLCEIGRLLGGWINSQKESAKSGK